MAKVKTTHLLECYQGLCRSGYSYDMFCNVLKTMPDGRLKIRVFGDRYRGRRKLDISRIRYVAAFRVRAKEVEHV